MLPGRLLDRPSFPIPENADNLFFRESRLLNARPPQVEENLTYPWPKIRGALQIHS